VLAYVVAGRTYGEIARELVISEKTVSAHISNLLHKTGTCDSAGADQDPHAPRHGRLAGPIRRHRAGHPL
jgi:predicted transcriptional regulator